MLIVRPGTCWNRVGRTVRFFAYYFYARAWCEVCGPSASFDAEELRVGERLPLVGAAASHEFWGSACMRIVRPGTCWNRVGRTVRFSLPIIFLHVHGARFADRVPQLMPRSSV